MSYIETTGLPGPQGPPGPAGVGAPFSTTFVDPLDTWVVNHNLGRSPAGVTITSLGGVELLADVQNVSVNQTRVYFEVPTAGTFTGI